MSPEEQSHGEAVARCVRYNARVVRAVSGADVEDGTVVVDDDRITYVGPRAGAPPGRDVELGDVILSPGLVNAHTHLDLTVLRGRFDGLSFFEWIRALTAARAALSPTELLESARAGIREGLLAGITTYADTAPNDAPFEAMRELGVRGIAYREVFGPDPAQRDASMDGLREAVAAMRARETPLVRAGVSPHAPYSVSDELFTAVATHARSEGLPLATHVAESDEESLLVATGEGAFAAFLRGRGIPVGPRGHTPVELLRAVAACSTRPCAADSLRSLRRAGYRHDRAAPVRRGDLPHVEPHPRTWHRACRGNACGRRSTRRRVGLDGEQRADGHSARSTPRGRDRSR